MFYLSINAFILFNWFVKRTRFHQKAEHLQGYFPEYKKITGTNTDTKTHHGITIQNKAYTAGWKFGWLWDKTESVTMFFKNNVLTNKEYVNELIVDWNERCGVSTSARYVKSTIVHRLLRMKLIVYVWYISSFDGSQLRLNQCSSCRLAPEDQLR